MPAQSKIFILKKAKKLLYIEAFWLLIINYDESIDMTYWQDQYTEETWGIKLWKYILSILPRILNFFIDLFIQLIRFLIETLRSVKG